MRHRGFVVLSVVSNLEAFGVERRIGDHQNEHYHERDRAAAHPVFVPVEPHQAGPRHRGRPGIETVEATAIGNEPVKPQIQLNTVPFLAECIGRVHREHAGARLLAFSVNNVITYMIAMV